MKLDLKKIVIVRPAAWRKMTMFRGKVRQITQSGAYISRMLGKKYASTTATYYGNDEIEYYPHAFGCNKFNDAKCDCGYEKS